MPDRKQKKESVKHFWKLFFDREQGGTVQKEFLNTWKYLAPVYDEFT